MEHILSLDNLRDAIFKHADMASLIALDQVSRTTRSAVRSYTYPWTMKMNGFGDLYDQESYEYHRIIGYKSLPKSRWLFLQRGPQIGSLKLDVRPSYTESDWHPLLFMYEAINLFADQLTRLEVSLYVSEHDKDSSNKFTRRSLSTISRVRLPRCTSLKLDVSCDADLLREHWFDRFLIMFPKLKQLDISMGSNFNKLEPILAALPAVHLLEKLSIEYSGLDQITGLADDEDEDQTLVVMDFSSLQELSLDLHSDVSHTGLQSIATDYFTGVDWFTSIGTHPPTRLKTVTLNLQDISPQWGAAFLIKLAIHCPAWQELALKLPTNKYAESSLVDELYSTGCPAGWGSKLRDLHLCLSSARVAAQLIASGVSLETLSVYFHSESDELDDKFRPIFRQGFPQLKILALRHCRNEFLKFAIIRAAPRLEHLQEPDNGCTIL